MTKCMDRKANEYFSFLYLPTDEGRAPTLIVIVMIMSMYIYSYNNTRQSYAWCKNGHNYTPTYMAVELVVWLQATDTTSSYSWIKIAHSCGYPADELNPLTEQK